MSKLLVHYYHHSVSHFLRLLQCLYICTVPNIILNTTVNGSVMIKVNDLIERDLFAFVIHKIFHPVELVSVLAKHFSTPYNYIYSSEILPSLLQQLGFSPICDAGFSS